MSKKSNSDEVNRKSAELRVYYTGEYYKRPELKIDRYLNEKKDKIFGKIKEYDRLLLISPTGSGKSRLILDNTDELLRTFNRIIFVVPILSLQAQMDGEWNTGLSINHNIRKVESTDYDSAKKITCTYRSLHKISSYFNKKDLIIFDEFHTFFDDNLAAFDKDHISIDIKSLERALISSASILALSATPQVFISRSMGFRSLIVSYKQPPYSRKVTIHQVPMIVSRLYYEIVTKKELLNKQKKKDNKILVYYKNIDALNYLFSFIFKSKYDSLKVKSNPVITGDKLRNNELAFNEFINEKFEDDNIIFTTNAITTGVSILNDKVKNILVFDVTDSNELIQLTSRFRNVNDIEIDLFLDDRVRKEKDNIQQKIVLNGKDLKDIKKNYNSIHNKKDSDFNTSVLQTIRKKQLKLLQSKYYHIRDYQLKNEIKLFPGYTCDVIRRKNAKVIIKNKEVREIFFKKTKDNLNQRHLLVFDLGIVTDNLGELFAIFKNKNFSIKNYNRHIPSFTDPRYIKASKIYFAINKKLDYASIDLLLSNWQHLKTTNANDFIKSILANYFLYKFFLKETTPNTDFKGLISGNYSIYKQLFYYALKKPHFKQTELAEKFDTYKFINDKEEKEIFKDKAFSNIVKGMFVLEKKIKVNSEYFLKFKQPTFLGARDRIKKDEGIFAGNNLLFIQGKEKEDNVLYVYKLTKNDDYELDKEKAKVLVPKSDIIKNMVKKF